MALDEPAHGDGGQGPPSLVSRMFGTMVFVLGVLGSALILALAGLIVSDVVGREAFGRPVAGVPELVAMSMVSIVFLQLAYALRSERLTRNGALIERLRISRPVFGHSLEAVFSLVGAVVFVMIFYTTLPYFRFAWTTNQYFGGMAGFFVPVWPVKTVTLIGSAAVAMQFVVRAWKHCGIALASVRK